MLKIRAFRAIDEEDTCLRYMEGHARVLADYGITNISTNNSMWKDSPSVYAILAEDQNGDIVGGIRLHLTDGITPLPAEKAVGDLDANMSKVIYSYPLGATGELCGLWNARKVAGWGLSVMLVRALVAITTQVDAVSLFTLCAPYTVYMTKPMGFLLEESVGDKGVLIYPVINHMARFFRNPDVKNLPFAEEPHLSRILSLRENPEQETIELITKQPVETQYQLLIESSPMLKAVSDRILVDKTS